MKQPFRFRFQGFNICNNFLQAAQLHRFIEIFCEADFIANLCFAMVYPGIRGIGQYFVLEKLFNTAFSLINYSYCIKFIFKKIKGFKLLSVIFLSVP